MGIRIERQKLYKFKDLKKSLRIKYIDNGFEIYGKIKKWDDIEIIARSYYIELEKLLYSKDNRSYFYKKTVEEFLKSNNLLNIKLFDLLLENNFDMDSIKVLLMNIDDYVYYNVKKHLPYIRELSLISNSINELLENTLKYANGEFYITSNLNQNDYPLKISIENKYNNIDKKLKENFKRLQDDIMEINKIEDSSKAIFDVLKKRNPDYNYIGDDNGSRLGFAKIRVETGAKFEMKKESEHLGKNGITIILNIPIKIYKDSKIQEMIMKILKNQ